MNIKELLLLGIGDPRLAVHATSPLPAWLWSTDGSRVLWANPVGARWFGAQSIKILAAKTFDRADPHRRQVAQLAGRLSSNGADRLERLRGFGAAPGMLMTCSCARLDFSDGNQGILIAALEAGRPTIPLFERLQLLIEGIEAPVAAFSRDGMIVAAAEAARPLLLGLRDLADGGFDEARTEALEKGRIERPIGACRMVLQRVGGGKDTGIVALVAPTAAPQPALAGKSGAPPGDSQPWIANPKQPGSTLVDEGGEHETAAAKAADEAARRVFPSRDDLASETSRHPLRFTWQMDADGRFALGADEFTRLIGPRTAARFGRRWQEIAEEFGLDAAGRVNEAVATRQIWSGITVYWPLDGGGRVPIELSGLPILDAERNFVGYRGFGVCRDLDSLAHLADLRRLEPFGATSAPTVPADIVPIDAQQAPAAPLPAAPVMPGVRVEPPISTSPQDDPFVRAEVRQNVVPFRHPNEPKSVALTPVENSAFNELARQLSARLDRDDASTQAASARGRLLEPAPTIPTVPEELDERAAGDQPEWLQREEPPAHGEAKRDRMLLDLLPTGVLIYRLDRLLYANPAFLKRIGYETLHELEHAGGLDALYVDTSVSSASSTSEAGTPVVISADHEGSQPSTPTEARLFAISWDGESALALIFAASNSAPTTLVEPAAAPMARSPAVAGHVNHEPTPSSIVGSAEPKIGEQSGERVTAILDNLTELASIEAGRLGLAFTSQNLNETVEGCVTMMQPHASRERIIIRTSLAQALPPVVADERALRQITLNLIGNSIRLANPAGQVIVSTALSDFGEVVLRVRDTGQGLNDSEVAATMDPLRAPSPSDAFSETSPVNLSLTKALVEANRAKFHIRTGGRSGTLIEVVFSHALE
jgi:PAS domain-containing protein